MNYFEISLSDSDTKNDFISNLLKYLNELISKFVFVQTAQTICLCY